MEEGGRWLAEGEGIGGGLFLAISGGRQRFLAAPTDKSELQFVFGVRRQLIRV